MKKLLLAISLLVATTAAFADAYFQMALTPDVAIYPKTTFVSGFSLNVWGENPQDGFAFGLGNGSTGDSRGFSLGLINYGETYRGAQWGLINSCSKEFEGWQFGVVNVSQGNFTGFQSGVINVAQGVTGFQFGVVNYAENLRGLQIGVVNGAVNNSWFQNCPEQLAKGFPLVNWSF